jgi:predicted aspartyl protease
MRHTMVWFTYRDAESYYEYPFAVHFFTNAKILPQDASDLALTILSRDFGVNVDNAKTMYVGYEELPVTLLREFYVAVAIERLPYGFEIRRISGEYSTEDAESILKYRLGRFTVDIDEYKQSLIKTTYSLAVALDTALTLSNDVKVYRSRQGYHVKATLEKPVSFEELIELRRKAFDDFDRIKIDLAYHEAGLTFLTNMLFSEKCVKESDKFSCFEEREVLLHDVVVTRESYVRCRFTRAEFAVGPISVRTAQELIWLTGKFKQVTKSFVERVVSEINRMCNSEETVKTAINAFGNPIIEYCDVIDLGFTLYVVAPKTVIGELIGRRGARVKSAEKALGKRVLVVPRESASALEVYRTVVTIAVRRALESL